MADIDDSILNQFTWQAYKSTPDVFKPQIEGLLLMQVVTKSKDQLNEDYMQWQKCYELLSGDSYFRSLLLYCWKRGSFDRLRKSDILQKPSGRLSPEQQMQVNLYDATITEVHGDAYTCTYHYHSDSERSYIATWFSDTDYSRIQRDAYSKRVEGTGDWFLSSRCLEEWMKDDRKRILWCTGMPGVGKTVISSITVRHLEKHGHAPVCFVYLNYKNRQRQSLRHILNSVLRQLYERYSPSREACDDFYNRHFSASSLPTLSDLISLLARVAQGADKVWVIIDALDEYLEHYSDDAVEALRDSLMAIPNLKLMLTSRVIGHMRRIFNDSTVAHQEIQTTDQDIEKYLRHRIITELPRDFKIAMGKRIIEHIKESAKQRFLLARLHMDSVSGRLTVGEIRTTLESLSEELDQVYQRAVFRIDEQGERHRQLAHEVIKWVTCTRKNLTMLQLQHALAAIPDRQTVYDYLYPEELITSVCAGLVVVNEQSGLVQFVHHTTQEFFEKTRGLYFPDADLTITEACFRYLDVDDVFDLERKDASRVYTAIDRLPLIRYMAENLGSHIQPYQHDVLRILPPYPERGVRLLVTLCAGKGHVPLHHWEGHRWNDSHFAATMNLPLTLQEIFNRRPGTLNIRERRSGFTPLTCAARVGATDSIRYLLSIDSIEVNSGDCDGNTPLAIASRHGNKEIVDLLLNNEATDVNLPNNNGSTPLHMAVAYGQLNIVKALLKHNHIAVNASNKHNRTPLFDAIQYRQGEIVAILIEDSRVECTRVDVSGLKPLCLAVAEGNEHIIDLLLTRDTLKTGFRDKRGRTLLSWAAENGMINIARRILDIVPCEADLRDYDGRTPLSYASGGLHLEMVAMLLGLSDVEINSKDSDGYTPLIYASRGGPNSGPTVDILIAKGAHLDLPDKSGRTPLSFAAESNGEHAINSLLRTKEVDVDSRDAGGKTPLFYAAIGGSTGVVSLLLRNSASLEARDSEGKTALFYALAAWGGSTDVAKTLLDAGAAVDARDHQGGTPLLTAILSSPWYTVELLLQYGADPEGKQCVEPGTTPLISAVRTRDESIVDVLLKHGADWNKPDLQGRTPLWYAAGNYWRRSLESILEKVQDIDSPDNDGVTPLMKAVINGNIEYIDLLIEKGANPNFKDNEGRTAIHYVARFRSGAPHPSGLLVDTYVTIAKRFLEAGVDINTEDNGGLTPLDHCEEEDLVELLKERGAKCTQPSSRKSTSQNDKPASADAKETDEDEMEL